MDPDQRQRVLPTRRQRTTLARVCGSRMRMRSCPPRVPRTVVQRQGTGDQARRPAWAHPSEPPPEESPQSKSHHPSAQAPKQPALRTVSSQRGTPAVHDPNSLRLPSGRPREGAHFTIGRARKPESSRTKHCSKRGVPPPPPPCRRSIEQAAGQPRYSRFQRRSFTNKVAVATNLARPTMPIASLRPRLSPKWRTASQMWPPPSNTLAAAIFSGESPLEGFPTPERPRR